VLLLSGAVFATANLERNTALRSARERVASQRLLTAMLDQETGARGFFQANERSFLEPWFQGTSAFRSSMVELRLLVAEDTRLQQMLADQEQRATAWHTATQTAILTLEHSGRTQSEAAALQAKGIVDGFRVVHAAFDASLDEKGSQSLSVATAVAVAVAVALAALLAGGGLLLTRRMARNEEARQHDQSELRELLQASESGQESRGLLIRHVEKLIRSAGGEEFLVLLPDTDRDAAMLVAEKLRSEIEHAELVGIGAISASLGLAVLPTDAGEPDELLRKADRALYTAKENGRNRVHTFSQPAAEVGQDA
jgi:CHASE3 domain sensor protein